MEKKFIIKKVKTAERIYGISSRDKARIEILDVNQQEDKNQLAELPIAFHFAHNGQLNTDPDLSKFIERKSGSEFRKASGMKGKTGFGGIPGSCGQYR